MGSESRRRARSTIMHIFVTAMGSALARAEVIHGRDGVHRIEKGRAIVTAAPALEKRLDKRTQTTTCPTSYSLCPDSLNGGCCQDGYECGDKSCFATTSAPQTCNGTPNWYPCAATVGGGCCPVGSICGRAGKCNPASGVPGECPPSHFLCPASVGYGCCRSGMGCGTNQCFYTTPSTYTYTKTITSEDVAVTTTITTTSTPVTPGETAEAASATVLKVYPSAIEKTTPIVSGDKDGGGLTKAQLGGIVGGTVVLLVAIVVATILVVRHLKRVVKAVEGTGGTGSKGSKSRPNMQQAIKPTAGSDTDAGSGIPFLHSRNSSRQTAGSGTNSPTPYGNGSGGGNGWSSPAVNNGYHSVPTSGGERGNQNSMDSARTGYFDAAASQRSAPRRPSEQLAAGRRTSSDSQGTNATPPRQRSNTNETTSTGDVPGSSSALQELDAYPFLAELPAHPADPSRLRSGSGSSGLPPRPPSTHQRNRSGGSTHTRSDSAAGMGTPQLDVVAEMAEVHGYYGPATHVGQTAADYPMPRSP